MIDFKEVCNTLTKCDMKHKVLNENTLRINGYTVVVGDEIVVSGNGRGTYNLSSIAMLVYFLDV